MKFLCIPCDQPMRLRRATGPQRGSVTLTYSCPTCGYGVAMMTNPHETQLVSSLGVQVGPNGKSTSASKCPMTGMLAHLDDDREAVRQPQSIPWTASAERRLSAMPEFVRPMARSGIEQFAAEHGFECVTDEVLDRARNHFHM